MSLTSFDNVEGMTKKARDKMDEFLFKIEMVKKINPVKSKRIEQVLGLRGVEVRGIVNYLRKRGHPIGSSSKGYWYAQSKIELEDTINHLKQRRTAIDCVIRGLENSTHKKDVQLEFGIKQTKTNTGDYNGK